MKFSRRKRRLGSNRGRKKQRAERVRELLDLFSRTPSIMTAVVRGGNVYWDNENAVLSFLPQPPSPRVVLPQDQAEKAEMHNAMSMLMSDEKIGFSVGSSIRSITTDVV